MQRCRGALNSKRPIVTVYLLNENIIQNLAEIPLNCNILIVGMKLTTFYVILNSLEMMPQENFRNLYEHYHKHKLNDEEWNLLLYILNKQKSARNIKIILQSGQFHEQIFANKSFPIKKIFKGMSIKWEKSIVSSGVDTYKNEVENRINDIQKELEKNDYTTFIGEKNSMKIMEQISQNIRIPEDDREHHQLDEYEKIKFIEDLDPLLAEQKTSRNSKSFPLLSTNYSKKSKKHEVIDYVNKNKEK